MRIFFPHRHIHKNIHLQTNDNYNCGQTNTLYIIDLFSGNIYDRHYRNPILIQKKKIWMNINRLINDSIEFLLFFLSTILLNIVHIHIHTHRHTHTHQTSIVCSCRHLFDWSIRTTRINNYSLFSNLFVQLKRTTTKKKNFFCFISFTPCASIQSIHPSIHPSISSLFVGVFFSFLLLWESSFHR